MKKIDRKKLDSLDLISMNERLSKIAQAVIEDIDHEILKKNTCFDINLRYLLTKQDKLTAIFKRIEDNNATISQIFYSDLDLTTAGVEETNGMTKRCRPSLILFDNNNTPQDIWPYNDIFSVNLWNESQWLQAKEMETHPLIYNPGKLLTGYVVFENRSPYKIWDNTDVLKTPQLYVTLFQDTMREEFENYIFPVSGEKANLVNLGIDLKYIKILKTQTTNSAQQGRSNVGFGQYIAFKFTIPANTMPYVAGEYKISFFLREPPLASDTDAKIALNQEAIYDFVLTEPLTIMPSTP